MHGRPQSKRKRRNDRSQMEKELYIGPLFDKTVNETQE